MPFAELDDLPGLLVDRHFESVDFDQQHGPGIERKAEVKRRFEGFDDSLIHHFQGRGDDPGPDDPADRLGRLARPYRTRPSIVRYAAGSRVSRTQTFVAMPNVPSLPTNRPVRS